MDNMKPITDEELAGAAGGTMSVQAWVAYANDVVVPILYRQCEIARGTADESIVMEVLNTLRGTMIRGASVADPVRMLYSRFMNSMAPGMVNPAVRYDVQNALSLAKNYIDMHP